MQETKVYREFREEVTKVVKDSSLFMSNKIKILQKQMSIGKSYFMGKELPHIIAEDLRI